VQEFADWTRVSLVGYKPVSSNKTAEALEEVMAKTLECHLGIFHEKRIPRLAASELKYYNYISNRQN
jgi:hypothetical protein